MKIKQNMINKELKATGFFMRLLPYLFNNVGLKFLGFLSNTWKVPIKSDSMDIYEELITRKDGLRFRVCIFRPKNKTERVPGILWLHGGGYAIGSPKQTTRIAKILMEANDCVVVSPAYRLSVEAPYPAALEDCYDTLLWMKDNAQKLGIRDDQLMVGGESAGGGLAVALSLYARDKHEVSIAFQMPLYPMLDDRMITPSSINNNAPVWNSKSNYTCWKLYLNDLFKTNNIPYYASPSRADDFSNLPPLATFVGDLEPFRDEVIEYVENLKEAKIPVRFEIFKGCYHAFEQICPNAEISKKAIQFMLSSYNYAVKNYFAKQI